MSISILVIGESGSGKSSAIRTLDPKETFIISVWNKPLPFKDYIKKYFSKEKIEKSEEIEEIEEKQTDKKINFYSVKPKMGADPSEFLKVHERISNCIIKISKERPDIKNIIIDDCQYILANEFLNRDKKEGYDRFTDIAKNFWNILNTADSAAPYLNIIFLTHSEVGEDGYIRCKTIGKLLREKINIEGMFTFVFHAQVINEEYKFETNGYGSSVAKTPMEMFEDRYIPNDLQLVINTINGYYGDIPF